MGFPDNKEEVIVNNQQLDNVSNNGGNELDGSVSGSQQEVGLNGVYGKCLLDHSYVLKQVKDKQLRPMPMPIQYRQLYWLWFVGHRERVDWKRNDEKNNERKDVDMMRKWSCSAKRHGNKWRHNGNKWRHNAKRDANRDKNKQRHNCGCSR
jgi:hypothetical protein